MRPVESLRTSEPGSSEKISDRAEWVRFRATRCLAKQPGPLSKQPVLRFVIASRLVTVLSRLIAHLEPDRLRWKHLASIDGVNQSLKQQIRAGRNAPWDSISAGPALARRSGETADNAKVRTRSVPVAYKSGMIRPHSSSIPMAASRSLFPSFPTIRTFRVKSSLSLRWPCWITFQGSVPLV